MSGADPAPMLRRLQDRAAIYEAFEQVGAAEAAMLMARDYTLQRYTFGRPLASYQAVKHNLANILVMVELARSNALHAAALLEAESPDLPAAAATARLAATRAYEVAARENLQLHGGIGFTWEADCHFHYRRARLLALNLGSAELWEERLIDALCLEDEAA
jgi:alkylation response protein AidB-like acyl-CoA dehydrogenase